MQNQSKNEWRLVEIIFILSIIIIVVGNFFLLNTIAIKNNTVTGNLFRATKLVQERMKIMVDIYGKKTDKLIVIDGHFYNWSELFNKTLTFQPCPNPQDPTSTCSDFILSNCPSKSQTTQTRCFIRNTHTANQDIWKIKQDVAPFSQKIRISNEGENAKKITVLIWWTDLLGLHKSVITRILEK